MNQLKKIFEILSKDFKTKLYFLYFLILLAVALEVLGIGLLIPLFDIILNKNIMAINFVTDKFNFTNLETTVLFIFIIFYFFKTLFLIFLSYKKAFFSSKIQKFISENLYKGYIEQDYSQHQKNKSSEQIRNILQEAALFSQVIGAYLLLATEFSVLFAIILFLLFYNFEATIIIFLLTTIVSIIIFYIPSKRLKYWGKQRQFHDNKKVKFIQDAFGSFKEIKILSLENFFINNYRPHNTTSADVVAKNVFISQLPRLFLEFFGVFCICSFTILLLFLKKDYVEILPLIAIYSAAGIRLLPSFTKLIAGMQKLKFSSVVIDLIYNEFKKLKLNKNRNSIEEINFNKNIVVSNLSFSYKENDKNILDHINFDIEFGDTIGVIGESGAGKSTLVNIITGLSLPSEGEVVVDGKNINTNLKSWYKNIGYVPQNIYLSDDTIKNNIAYGKESSEIDSTALNYALEKSNLKKFIKTLNKGLDTQVGELGNKISGGQKQRIGIARALYIRPKLLILDEATNALDEETENKIIEELRILQGSITIMFITHRHSTLSYCKKIFKLESGKLYH
jgi:ABC-type multidrug transport system fused ATPase/permease subunit